MDVLVALSSPLGVTVGVGVGGVRTVIVMLSSSLPVMLPARSSTVPLPPWQPYTVSVASDGGSTNRVPEHRLLLPRTAVESVAKPSQGAMPRRLPLSRHRRRPANVNRRLTSGQPAARRWRRRRCGDGRPGGVTGSLQGPRYPPSCCRGEQPAGRRGRPPGCHRSSGIPRLPRNRGRYCRASFPAHSVRTFPVGGSPENDI